MLATMDSSSSRRRALRRAVRMECVALSALWDDTAALVATDLSPHGLWLSTELPLEVGEELVLSFRPPCWPKWGAPLSVLARVARVGLPRRRGDAGPPGMGLSFLDLDTEAGQRMASLLRGLPPPLPLEKPAAARLERSDAAAETTMLADGLEVELCAEAPLLTAGRARRATVAPAPAKTLVRAKYRSRRHRSRSAIPRRRAPPITARRSHLRLVG